METPPQVKVQEQLHLQGLSQGEGGKGHEGPSLAVQPHREEGEERCELPAKPLEGGS